MKIGNTKPKEKQTAKEKHNLVYLTFSKNLATKLGGYFHDLTEKHFLLDQKCMKTLTEIIEII